MAVGASGGTGELFFIFLNNDGSMREFMKVTTSSMALGENGAFGSGLAFLEGLGGGGGINGLVVGARDDDDSGGKDRGWYDLPPCPIVYPVFALIDHLSFSMLMKSFSSSLHRGHRDHHSFASQKTFAHLQLFLPLVCPIMQLLTLTRATFFLSIGPFMLPILFSYAVHVPQLSQRVGTILRLSDT
jgi:hypothetical protein